MPTQRWVSQERRRHDGALAGFWPFSHGLWDESGRRSAAAVDVPSTGGGVECPATWAGWNDTPMASAPNTWSCDCMDLWEALQDDWEDYGVSDWDCGGAATSSSLLARWGGRPCITTLGGRRLLRVANVRPLTDRLLGTRPNRQRNLSVSLWFHADEINTAGSLAGQTAPLPTGTENWAGWRMHYDTGEVMFQVGASNAGSGSYASAAADVGAGGWVHVVGVFRYDEFGNGDIRLYVDGREARYTDRHSDLFYDVTGVASELLVGGARVGTGSPTDVLGQILCPAARVALVRLYERPLSARDVAALHRRELNAEKDSPAAVMSPQVTRGLTLWLRGYDMGTSGLTLYTSGGDPSAGLKLYVRQMGPVEAGLTLHTLGYTPTSVVTDFTGRLGEPRARGANVVPAYAEYARSRGIPLFVDGVPAVGTPVSAGKTLYVAGVDVGVEAISAGLPLVITGYGIASQIPLYTEGGEIGYVNQGVNLYTGGGWGSLDGNIPLVALGGGDFDCPEEWSAWADPEWGGVIQEWDCVNGVVPTLSRGLPLYLAGNPVGLVELGMNLYLGFPTTEGLYLTLFGPAYDLSAGKTLFVQGMSPVSSGLALSLPDTHSRSTQFLRLYTRGY